MLRSASQRFIHYQSTLLQNKSTSKSVDVFRDAYDYIIVGAGAAGNVLASRLTEDANAKVLLLDCGPGPEASGTQTESRGYKTVPQERACRGLVNRQMNYTSGRGMGGLENINYLSYTCGSRYDYDEWEELGCNGWAYKDVLPYFMKSETNNNSEYVKSGYHGSGGPMKISDLSETRLVKAFLEAGKELGYDILDVNGKSQLGFSNGQGYLHEGQRYTTVQAYREPALNRDNLDFASNANVRKVLIENGQSTGVELVRGGKLHSVRALKEVILSAGAVESPRLLLLSGVGPADHLSKLSIKVQANLPVGENLQDHPMCMLEYVLQRPTKSLELEQHRRRHDLDHQQDVLYTKEKMKHTQGAIAFLRTRFAAPDRLYPDIQLHLGNSLIGGIFKNIWNMRNEVWHSLYKHNEGQLLGMYISTMLLHPKSVGTIRLRGPDPDLEPLIDPKFLHHPDDAQTLKEGLKLQFQLQTTDCFSRIGAELSPLGLPEVPNKHHHGSAIYSDDYLERFVRSQTLTGHHPAGTCKMGAPSDTSAVVDTQLKVFGINGLRVVDSSVMPRVTSGNTGAPTIMIAEKASDIIRGINSVSNIKIPDEVLEELGTKARSAA